MARSYIQLRDETMTAGSYKKVKVLWTDFSEGTVSQQAMERAANGKLLVSIGKTFRMWRGLFKIDFTPASGFAGKSDLEKWFTSDDPAERKLTMIDNYSPSGTTWSVFILTPAEFKYGSPVPDGVSSFYLIPFEMQTREAVTI